MTEIKRMKGDYQVSQAHPLLEAYQGSPFTLQETRLVLTLLSLVETKKETEFKDMKISVSEFSTLLGLTEPNYTEIKNITFSLTEKAIQIKKKDTQKLLSTPWFAYIEYCYGEGFIEYKFAEKLVPYLLQLRKYTKHKLKYVLVLKSVYTVRLYQLGKKWEGTDGHTYDLNELRKMLGAGNKSYNTFADFKRRILTPASKEINKKTDIEVKFEEIKTGRKVTHIRISALPLVIDDDKNGK